MKRIELTGPSGVGKTTLYNQIFSTSLSQRSYLTHWEAYVQAAQNEKIELNNIKLKLMQIALKSGLFKKKERGISKRIIYKIANDKGVNDTHQFENFSVSFNIQYQAYLKREDPLYVFKRISSLFKNIEEYMVLEYYFPNDQRILFDEGMLHTHGGISKYGFSKFTTAELNKDKLLNPSGIISCEQSADVIYEQALDRMNKGVYTFSHSSLNNKELKQWIDKNVKYHSYKIASLKKYGIPVLHLNTGDTKESNIKKINQFALRLK